MSLFTLCRRLPLSNKRWLASSSSNGDLLRDGYTIFRNILEPSLVAQLQQVSAAQLADPRNSKFQADSFTGSLIPVSQSDAFAKLIANPQALSAFESLKLGSLGKWMSGFLISKPAGSPSLGWHQDGWFWDKPIAYQGGLPAQVFAMYYLTDTTLQNGCLRVIPGSHRTPHPLHRQLQKAHSEQVRSGSSEEWSTAVEHRAAPNCERNLPVKAGDLVIGDARILHGARPNTSSERRSLITLWYMPQYEHVGEEMQKQIAELHMHQCGDMHTEWGAAELASVQGLLPTLFKQLDSGGGDGYNHNLDFMHRQPGFVQESSAEAKAAFVQAMGENKGQAFVEMSLAMSNKQNDS